jgi:DNA invertase Pin-like site-specific DNA recombinase
MLDNMKVGIYCRAACFDEQAINKQESELRGYAENQGFSDIAVYSDNGHGGMNFERPAFSEMERDIEAGKVNIVICIDLSRISRNTSDTIKWLNKIKRKGVKFKGLRDFSEV